MEALLAAYFTNGRDVGDPDILADVGAEAGIERARTLTAIADPASTEAVIKDESLARGLRLNGVPSVVFDGRYLFSGAQPVGEIVRALRAAAKIMNASQAPTASPAEAGDAVLV